MYDISTEFPYDNGKGTSYAKYEDVEDVRYWFNGYGNAVYKVKMKNGDVLSPINFDRGVCRGACGVESVEVGKKNELYFN